MLSRAALQQQCRLIRRVPCHWQHSGNNQTIVVLRWNNRRWLSAKSTPVVEKAQTQQQEGRWRSSLRRFAFFVKMLRIPALGLSVYALGRQQGIIECSRNPRLIEDELLQTILMDVGVKDRSQVQIYSSEDSVTLAATSVGILQSKTIRIGNDIVRCASLFVRKKLAKAIQDVKDKQPSDVSQEDFIKACHKDENFAYWTQALYRVEGEDPNIPWKYILIDSPLANAFVTEILPQRFFVTTKMFDDYIENEDELAVVLGHEMSHLILGHVSQRNNLETALRTVEVLLLSIDPTEGLMSLGVIAGLAWMRGVLMASFSREHETEADELGTQLAAMACYDTKRGSLVMKKMHDHQVKMSGQPKSNSDSHLLHLLDSHPPSIDRYEKILKQSETENPQKYNSQCATIQERMIQAVWGGRGN
ncbi:Metalloendopeptidase OMA1, mitochondrial [Seminavis robusta]|uniref:Metalloendopeptidase OMA1, mitochondrial n=1 Tax=Seminavis robusta TaxID=568900 RepID=A0A9N8HTD1_9STRA|nr:Metalloendopeptidase OMA1, mitochondrial [Seminavis robusta]|eukprot:Sro1860_g302100.1 Metalloendopeptidase OMA1, mitochondrial (418) ;mRNA; f:6530-8010